MDQPPTTSAAVSITAPPLLRRIINLDTSLSLHIHTLAQPIIPRPILKTLEISGDGRFFFPITLSLLLAPPLSPLRSFLLSLLIGSLLDLIVIGTVKFLVRRPRPVYNKGMSLVVSVDHWSFPSGHSSRVWLIASYYCLCSAELTAVAVKLFGGDGSDYVEERVRFGVFVVCVWATMTSISRVLLGRHFVFDVVAGACFGVLEAVFVFRFLKM